MKRVAVRHVEVNLDEPVTRWPAEAIEAVLDRGHLTLWRRIAAAIDDDPYGYVARVVEASVSAGEHYGVDELMARRIITARQRFDRRGRLRYAEMIRRWRHGTGMTQREFSRHVGTSAPALNRYERGHVSPTTDVLARIEAVAGRLAAADDEAIDAVRVARIRRG